MELQLTDDVILKVVFEGLYTECRCFDDEHSRHLKRVSELPRNQQPLDYAYWQNRRPFPYISAGTTFEEWRKTQTMVKESEEGK